MSVKNIVNNYEVNLHLEELISEFPQYESFICSNMRNYIIRFSPVSPIAESNAHMMYQSRNFSGPNPEITAIKDRVGLILPELHHLHINPSLIYEFKKVLAYLSKENISPKNYINVKDLIKKVTLIDAKNKYEDMIKEGLTRQKLICENGLIWVELTDNQSFRREANLMKNCILNYYLAHQRGECRIYSLRNNRNKPLTTVEVRERFIMSYKGFANTPSLFETEVLELATKLKLQKNVITNQDLMYEEYMPLAFSFRSQLSHFLMMTLLIFNLKLEALFKRIGFKPRFDYNPDNEDQ